MRPTTKRPTSQSPFIPVPEEMKHVSVPMPFDVDLSCMEWTPMPEPASAVVSAFRTAATEPLGERLQGILAVEGGQR
jgi:hypothetical protein